MLLGKGAVICLTKPSILPTLQIWYRGYDLDRKKFEVGDICFVQVKVGIIARLRCDIYSCMLTDAWETDDLS